MAPRRTKKPARVKTAPKRASGAANVDNGSGTSQAKRAFPPGFDFAPLELNRGAPARRYLLQSLFPALNDGLREVNKTRPEQPVKWLGEYLLRRSAEPRAPITSLRTDTSLEPSVAGADSSVDNTPLTETPVDELGEPLVGESTGEASVEPSLPSEPPEPLEPLEPPAPLEPPVNERVSEPPANEPPVREPISDPPFSDPPADEPPVTEPRIDSTN